MWLCLLALGALLATAQDFFMISDVHFDLNYRESASAVAHCHGDAVEGEQSIAKFNCDSSLPLLQSALSFAAATNPDPDFIILAGDVLTHFSDSLTGAELLSSFQTVAEAFQATFPRAQLVLTLGNNDSYEDYVLPSRAQKSLYEFLAALWKPLTGDLPESFVSGGFYSVSTRTGRRIIVLNTNFFSIFVEHDTEAAAGQFRWLEEQLSALEDGQKAIIVMHIPPGPSMFKGVSYDWHSCYIERFLSILYSFSSKVALVLAGHQHKSGFQLIPQSELGVLVTPALSPIFKNNPGFRRYNITDESVDYEDFFLNLWAESPQWERHFRFREFFGSMQRFDFEKMYEQLANEETNHLFEFVARAHGLGGNRASESDLWKIAVALESPSVIRRTALCAYKFLRNFDFELCKWGVLSEL